MKIYENGIIRDMTPEEVAAMEAIPVLPQEYSVQEASVTALRCLLAGSTPTTSDERIQCAVLYPEWAAGAHTQGEIYTTQDQVWECYQAYDNAVYPDITPGSAALISASVPVMSAFDASTELGDGNGYNRAYNGGAGESRAEEHTWALGKRQGRLAETGERSHLPL